MDHTPQIPAISKCEIISLQVYYNKCCWIGYESDDARFNIMVCAHIITAIVIMFLMTKYLHEMLIESNLCVVTEKEWECCVDDVLKETV